MLIGAYSALATLCKSQPTEAEIYAKTAIDLMKRHETDTEKFLSVYQGIYCFLVLSVK